MTQLNISLTDTAHDFIADQIASGRYGSPSEYLQELVEQASEVAARENLATLLEEGENSGPGTEYTAAEWAQRVNELRAQVPRGKVS